MKNKPTKTKRKGNTEENRKELDDIAKETKSIQHNSVILARNWSSDLVKKNQQKSSNKNNKLSTQQRIDSEIWTELNKQKNDIDTILERITVLEQKIENTYTPHKDKTNVLEETIISTTTRKDTETKEIYLNKVERLTIKRKERVNLFNTPRNKFKVGDRVRINNNYSGKYGNLFGRIGRVHKIGTSFVFIEIPGIPEKQQRAECNLDLVE